MDHSDLGPSQAEQWHYCPASPMMQALFVDEETEDSRDGTASHWVMEAILTGQPCPRTGDTAPNGVVLTYEMISCAQLFADEVIQNAGERGIKIGDPMFKVEDRVFARSIHADVWGTADQWFYDAANDDLFIHDYKFGHRVVKPYENKQLLCYACGILEMLQSLGHDTSETTVWMIIIQPRSFHETGPIRHWVMKARNLTNYFNELKASAAAARSPDAQCVAGLHCRDCRANHQCEAFTQAALSACDYVANATTNANTPTAVGGQLKILRRCRKLIDYRIEALEPVAITQLRQGHMVTGFSMTEAKGRLKWNASPAQIIKVGEALGVELAKEDTITPTQAKKLLDESVINSLAHYPARGFKLVDDEERRPEAVFSQPVEGFKPW